MKRDQQGRGDPVPYNGRMSVHGFRLSPSRLIPLDLPASSLDGLTGSVSDGFYSTFATLSGGTRVLGLSAHLKRLYAPASDLRLHPSVSETALRRHIANLAHENLPAESRIRIILTRDTGDIYIGIQPFAPLPDSIYKKGVNCLTAEMARHDPRIKGTDFIAKSAEQRKRVQGDVFEILMTRRGGILEGMTSNFYAVLIPQDSPCDSQNLFCGVLITAQKGILPGVTRRAVLRLARGEGMSIEYRPPRMDEEFDEAFLTSSSRGVVPIVKIDGRRVGQGKPGAWTKTLSLAYQAYVGERSEKIIP